MTPQALVSDGLNLLLDSLNIRLRAHTRPARARARRGSRRSLDGPRTRARRAGTGEASALGGRRPRGPTTGRAGHISLDAHVSARLGGGGGAGCAKSARRARREARERRRRAPRAGPGEARPAGPPGRREGVPLAPPVARRRAAGAVERPQAQPGRRGRGEKCRHRHTHIAQLLYTFRTYHEALPCCRLLQIYGSMQ